LRTSLRPARCPLHHLVPGAFAILLVSACRPPARPVVSSGVLSTSRPSGEPTSLPPAPAAEKAAAPQDQRGTAAPPRLPLDQEAEKWEAWIKSRLPAGGTLDGDRPSHVVHTVREGETVGSIASLYVDLTGFYLPDELAGALRAELGLDRGQAPKPGSRILIPGVLSSATYAKSTARIRWPDDKALRGLYVRGPTAAGRTYLPMLDRMVERGMNIIVLDAKDYDGWLTYPSKVPLAIESGATKNAPIRSLSRAIQFAHARGILVAVRISCFEDEVVAKAKGELSVQAIWGRPYRIGWLDPANEGAQKYLLDLAREAIEAGADEIQLDYVRYPVLGIKGADFKLESRRLTKTAVITEFVRKMHALTHSQDVPLSLDVFGVVAEGRRVDIDQLGQDPVLLAAECEALSPMVYPSHYRAGYQGFEVPGNHPEIVGISTRKILEQLRGHVESMPVVRPWLQAASFNSPDYGPAWVAAEVRHAEGAGATGWLMWNPTQTYTVTWRAVPLLRNTGTQALSGPSIGSEPRPDGPGSRPAERQTSGVRSR
jgi:hypothetical protein